MPRDHRPVPPVPPSVSFDWDPATWERVGARAIQMVRAASTEWDERSPTPTLPAADVRKHFNERLPERGVGVDAVLDRLADQVLPLSSFNGHPAWFGYITSSPNPVGVVGDLVASAINQNPSLFRAGPAAISIELQVTGWLSEMLGYSSNAEGIFSSGGQFANVIAHAVARTHRSGWDVRRFGMSGPDGMVRRPMIYVSDQAHYCHDQAAELLGMGRESVRKVPSDQSFKIRLDALANMLAEDRAAGRHPMTLVANAGTVGTGAVDPIPEMTRIAEEEKLWLHVDGAYGAFGAIADTAPDDLRAMAAADSIACDPHKWLYAPIDAGVTLVRQPGLLNEAFAFQAAYLRQVVEPGRVDLVERTPENTRSFRALKVWLALQAYGVDGYREMIEWNIELARYMAELIDAAPDLQLAAPRELSIVCWRCVPADAELDGAQIESLQWQVIQELERRGVALVSNTRLHDGSTALRACIVNFRTRPEHLERLVRESALIARELVQEIAAA